MIRGISKAGLGSITDEQLVSLAGHYGFQALEIDPSELVSRHGLDKTREQLLANGLILGAFGLPTEWRKSESLFRDDLKSLAEKADTASKLGCTSCCTYILPSVDEPAAAFMAQTVRRLRQAASILGAYGIRLALEFVGPHHLRTAWANPFIYTVEDTLSLVDAIGLNSVGLLVDSYHCYTTGFTGEQIAKLNAAQIVHVHLNDARDLPVSEVLDFDRLYPGEGVIDLKDFLQGLQAAGYEGVVAQEILTPSQPEASPEALLARSQQGFDRVFV